MPAYNEMYVADIMETQGNMFMYIRDLFPGIDERWFIESYMKSKTRKALDSASPKWAGMWEGELAKWFLHQECNNEYKRGDPWGGFLPQWVGMMYALYQWKYNVPSKDIVDVLTLAVMERCYNPFHELGEDAALAKLHEVACRVRGISL